MSKVRLPRDQILDWTENPVTKLVLKLVEEELQILEDRCKTSEVFHPFDPQRTQEIMAGLNGSIDTWFEVAETLEGKGLFDYADSSGIEDEE